MQALQSYAENGELSKIQDSIDYIRDNFQNDELSSETINSIFDAYTKAQLDLLDQLPDTPGEKDTSVILDDAWQITSDVDDLLQEYGARKNSHLNAQHFEKIIQAWDRIMLAYEKMNVQKKGFPQRATYHIEVMERLALNNNMIHLSPTIDTYNTVLHMWSRSQEHSLTSMTESIMRRISGSYLSQGSTQTNISENFRVEPNAETYRIMIRSWSRVVNDVALSKRKIGNAAFNATGYLMKMQSMMEKEDSDFEPTLEDYKVVLGAWSKGRYAKYAGKRALSLLKKMEGYATSENEFTNVKPDVACYESVLLAMSESKAEYLKGLGYQAEDILTRMEVNALVPTTNCFMYAIKIWSNSACRNELTQKEIFDDAQKTHQLLDRMSQMHDRSGLVVVKPTTVDYNNVMRAWSRCSSRDAVRTVKHLLSKLEKQYAEGDSGMMPNHESYLYVIQALGNSPDVQYQTEGVLDVLSQMKEQYNNGNDACKPNIICYNAVIAACGTRSLKSASEQEKREVLKCVIEIVQQLRKNKEIEPTSKTYNLTLEAFDRLLDRKSPEFKKIVDSVFFMCCNEGLVDDNVIKTFHRVAPHEVYRRSVLSKASPDFEIDETSQTLFLPEEWTRNINGIRQRIPLAVDGRFVHARSPSVSEHKMRRLRKKQNKSLLQGGRL